MCALFSRRLKPRQPRRIARPLAVEALEVRQVLTAMIPLAGDWDGDGRASIGLYSPEAREFYLRDVNAPGFPHRAISPASVPTDAQPLAGDWNGDGSDTPGWFSPGDGTFTLLQQNGQVAQQIAAPDSSGEARALAGDFDGDGATDVALYSPSSQTSWIHTAGAWTATRWSDLPSVDPGVAFTPFAGDFDGDGRAEVALWDQARGVLHRDQRAPLPLTTTTAFADHQLLFGNWDGRGGDRPGWFEAETGLFTPSYIWGVDPLASPLYVVPSANVNAHLDAIPRLVWQNSQTAEDLNGDGVITSLDAMTAINMLNAFGARPLPDYRAAAGTGNYLDISGDGLFTPLDALLVINTLNSGPRSPGASPTVPPTGEGVGAQLTASEVSDLLARAAAASSSNDAIIAIVDRGGRILGVRAESDVLATITNADTLVFAIDGAVAKARTAAFFSSNAAPLTSRTVRFVSQSTVTQREVQSNPNVGDFSSPLMGPGFVAPVGLGGHFPPGVSFTPPVDLFAIEHSNRDSVVHPGLDGIKGNADDIALASRFNVAAAYIAPGQEMEAPESYGYTSANMPQAQSRGIATLPGGIPIYRDTDGNGTFDCLLGGIGVFFPGSDGYATFEQGFVAGVGQTENARTNAPKVLEAEWIAFATLGGVAGPINGAALPAGLGVPTNGRIDLVGITLEAIGPHPTTNNPQSGIDTLKQVGASLGFGSPASGANQNVTPGLDLMPGTGDDVFTRAGLPVPSGWLVLPHGAGSLSATDVERIVDQSVAEANLVRAAIRLPIGSRTQMIFAVSDLDGDVLGLYRMADAPVFSLDVAVAKARNEAYYADPTALVMADRVDDNRDGLPDLPQGTSLTARTFRFLAEPRYPSGIDGTLSGAFSILRDAGINPTNAENLGPALPAAAYTSTLGFDAFHIGRNFRDPANIANQNGTVFFPGSTPLYVSGTLVGGFGVSGDGVDQDDVVTFGGSVGFQTPAALRADQYFVRGVRLPFQKFLRNPHG